MDASDVLTAVEHLSNGDRTKYMVELGRSSVLDNDARNAISQLWSGNTYTKLQALRTCYGSRDVSMALEITSLCPVLTPQALRIVAIFGTDDQVIEHGSQLCVALLLKLGGLIQKRHKVDGRMSHGMLIDAILCKIRSLGSHGAKNVMAILPYATETTVRTLLPEFKRDITTGDNYRFWALLIKRHPRTVYQWLLHNLEEFERTIPSFHKMEKYLIDLLLRQLLKSEDNADKALRLFDLMMDINGDTLAANVQTLMIQRPVQTAQILIDYQKFFKIRPKKCYRLLPPDILLELLSIRSMDCKNRYSSNLRYMTASQKDAWYLDDLQKPHYTVPIENATYLKPIHRIEQARLAVPKAEGDAKLSWASLLPWDEAMDVLLPALSSSESGSRQGAIESIINAVTCQSSMLSEALDIILGHRLIGYLNFANVFTSLNDISASSWKEEHLGRLENLMQVVLSKEKPGLEESIELGYLIERIGLFHPTWAAPKLLQLIDLVNWDLRRYRMQNNNSVRLCIKYIDDILDEWYAKQNISALAKLACYLNSSMNLCLKLCDTMELLLREELPFETPRLEDFVNTLLYFRPKPTAAILESLLHKNILWANVPCVRKLILTKCTHFISQSKLLPVDDSNQDIYLFKWLSDTSIKRNYSWWTRVQQTFLKNLLVRAIEDPERSRVSLRDLFWNLEQLRFIDVASITQFLPHENSTICKMALESAVYHSPTQLGNIIDPDHGKYISQVLQFFPKALDWLPSTSAFEILKRIPLSDVRSTSQALHFVSRYKTRKVFDFLLETYSKNQHETVGLSCLRCLSLYYSHEPQTYQLVMSAAASKEHGPLTATALLYLHPRGIRILDSDTRELDFLCTLLGNSNPDAQLKALRMLDRTEIEPPSSPQLARSVIRLLSSPYNNICGYASKVFFIAFPRLYAALYIQEIADAFACSPSLEQLKIITRWAIDGLSRHKTICIDTTIAIMAALERASKKLNQSTIHVQAQLGVSCLPWPGNLFAIVKVIEEAPPDMLIDDSVKIFQRVKGFGGGNLAELEQALYGRSYDFTSCSEEQRILKVSKTPDSELVTNEKSQRDLSSQEKLPEHAMNIRNQLQDTGTPNPLQRLIVHGMLPSTQNLTKRLSKLHSKEETRTILRRLGLSALYVIATRSQNIPRDVEARFQVYERDTNLLIREAARSYYRYYYRSQVLGHRMVYMAHTDPNDWPKEDHCWISPL